MCSALTSAVDAPTTNQKLNHVIQMMWLYDALRYHKPFVSPNAALEQLEQDEFEQQGPISENAFNARLFRNARGFPEVALAVPDAAISFEASEIFGLDPCVTLDERYMGNTGWDTTTQVHFFVKYAPRHHEHGANLLADIAANCELRTVHLVRVHSQIFEQQHLTLVRKQVAVDCRRKSDSALSMNDIDELAQIALEKVHDANGLCTMGGSWQQYDSLLLKAPT